MRRRTRAFRRIDICHCCYFMMYIICEHIVFTGNFYAVTAVYGFKTRMSNNCKTIYYNIAL